MDDSPPPPPPPRFSPVKCFLCLDLVRDDPLDFNSKTFHRKCMNAVKCYRRYQRNAGKLERADKNMLQRTDSWRNEVLPLVKSDASGARNRQARADLKAKCKISKKFMTEERQTTRLLLTKRRYKSYMQFWERQDSDAASDGFETLVKKQGWASRSCEGPSG